MSGRSSRSTLIATTLLLTTAATAGSSNDSCAITWHQWHAAYPTDRNTGTSRRRASSNASGDHGHQSTGLSACCSRYGLVALFSRFINLILYLERTRLAPGGTITPFAWSTLRSGTVRGDSITAHGPWASVVADRAGDGPAPRPGIPGRLPGWRRGHRARRA